MKRNTTIFLQVIVATFGIGLIALMLIAPHFEGRNVGATSFEIYFKDPFLAFVYLGSIPFFVALYQIIKVLGYARQDKISSPAGLKALQAIRYGTFITAGAIIVANVYLTITARSTGEDAAGAAMLGLIATLICLIIGAIATKYRRVFQRSANNLTA